MTLIENQVMIDCDKLFEAKSNDGASMKDITSVRSLLDTIESQKKQLLLDICSFGERFRLD